MKISISRFHLILRWKSLRFGRGLADNSLSYNNFIDHHLALEMFCSFWVTEDLKFHQEEKGFLPLNRPARLCWCWAGGSSHFSLRRMGLTRDLQTDRRVTCWPQPMVARCLVTVRVWWSADGYRSQTGLRRSHTEDSQERRPAPTSGAATQHIEYLQLSPRVGQLSSEEVWCTNVEKDIFFVAMNICVCVPISRVPAVTSVVTVCPVSPHYTHTIPPPVWWAHHCTTKRLRPVLST